MPEANNIATGKALGVGAGGGVIGSFLILLALGVADLNRDNTQIKLSMQRITMLQERMYDDVVDLTSEISVVDEVARECSARLTAHESAADARAEVWRDSMRQWRDEESSDR